MPGKYDHIDFTPPDGVRRAAEIGLAARRKSGKGGLSNKQASDAGIGSGVQRAVNLKNGDKLSPETVKRMHSFFSRHSAYKKNHEPGNPESRSWVSWQLWGSDEGKRWSEKIVNMMKRADQKK